jgi:LytS/YehU family sensor histidine kinase
VAGSWLLVQLFDRMLRLRSRPLRVLARPLVIGVVSAVVLVGSIPVIIASERVMGWTVTRDADDFTGQFEVNVVVFTVYALIYWVWRRRVVSQRTLELVAQADASLREARLHALALELQPHFLHNALNGIAQLVREDPDAAESMLVTLGDLLRATMGAGRTAEHPLADELVRLELYLDVQRMRFADRLQVVHDIHEEARGVSVPTMVLQPLVENALHHGIGRRAGAGTVSVHAEPVPGAAGVRRLRLIVRDDGAGFDAAPPREGVGLRNTRERLAVLYPGMHSLELRARSGGGVDVIIELPWRVASAVAA